MMPGCSGDALQAKLLRHIPKEARTCTGQQSNHVKTKSFGCDHTIAAAVSAKLEDGNIKAAAKLLCSGGTPAEICDQTFAELQSKHPTPITDRPSSRFLRS